MSGSLFSRMGLLFGLGGTQGLFGWWMFNSGLKANPKYLINNEKHIEPEELVSYFNNNRNTLMLYASLTVLGTLFIISIQNNSFSSVNTINDYTEDTVNILQDILNGVNSIKYEHNIASYNKILANQELLITLSQPNPNNYKVHSSVYDMAEKLTYI